MTPGRLDVVLVELGLARSRTLAARLVREGRVLVDGRPARRPSTTVRPGQHIEARTEHWVSRGAYKLLGALEDLPVPVSGRVLDAGASTGGFTQVLLESGAERVYAVDVGHGQLNPSLAADERVVVREGLNLRSLVLDDLEGSPVDLVVGDVSFISLRMLLGPLDAVCAVGARMLLLVKPQFEVGRTDLGAHGVVTDQGLRDRAVDRVVADAAALGWMTTGRAPSRIAGQDGNQEYFIRLERAGS
ncbi:TlyA family rRNA (cytidine-2'-O)-methyltransferase [Acidipropionibacterium acidipropionici]|uniref:Cytochrome-c peroxidase n=2 Tax=Acidipropionibacterium acidipropionici TaxID=1748 RepID=A0AAC8YCP0_9ACTN|nr:TlyA family RNA methyltransferase [Acidipropionibacterium acidipropionici]AFV89878.1 Ribosomal RNA large subunit methyltransferase J [Acidipropionibacterium acidipropionici ATCC 4875]AMS04274.1 cytochrome-c peroxidase [Acidipropionibacterium acidipropionici]AOZ45767.1 cytochrome-c peroxidase [Acidipropionibacterium acidipropionici]AZP38225.1 TlyA family rRNA (cytidine-2'-O)-methyltransferase [Acidipropionibacterium acidipropionici]